MDIKRIVEKSDTRAGRAFDALIQLLIVVSLVSITLETLPGLSPGAQRIFRILEATIVVAFTLEYSLRLLLADHKLAFVFSFYGITDLLAILPFYIASGVDLRSIRVLRLLRLFRVFKLIRYTEAIQRVRRAFLLAKEEIVLFLCVSLGLLYLAAVGIYYFERIAQPDAFGSVFQSLWWAVTTLTIGYGTAYPVTIGGKVFTSVLLLLGLGLVAAPAGLVASALTEARLAQAADARRAPGPTEA